MRNWALRLRPRSVRGRLVGTYTLVAVLLAAAGIAVFALLLNQGLSRSLDTVLSARSEPLTTTLAAAPGPDPSRSLDLPTADDRRLSSPARRRVEVDSVTAIYRPDGALARLEPSVLRQPILTPTELALARTQKIRAAITVGGDHLRLLAAPVRRADGTWVVVVGANLDLVTAAGNEATRQLLIAIPALIAIAALGAWLLSGAALRPVERLRIEAAEIGARDPDNRLSVPDTADELARLADTFNGLLDRLGRSVTRQRDLVADAGHELRTPLAVLRIELDLADRPTRTREDLADSIAHARSEVDRLCRLADDLLFLARVDGNLRLVERRDTDLAPVVAAAARAARAAADSRGLELVVAGPPVVPVRGDPQALRRAVDNLVSNALAATPAGGTVTVLAERVGRSAVLSVSDTGSGFPPDFVERAFERFGRPEGSRGHGGGAGLGLAIVAEVARAHNGRTEAANRPGGGAVVTVMLPDDVGRPDWATASPVGDG